MSFRHVGLPELGLLIGVGYGGISERAFNASFDRAIAEGAYLPGANRLVVIAAGSVFEGIDFASLARIHNRIRTQETAAQTGPKRAAVLAPDPAVDWFPQLYAALWTQAGFGESGCHIAASLEDALAWLGCADACPTVEHAIVGAMLRP